MNKKYFMVILFTILSFFVGCKGRKSLLQTQGVWVAKNNLGQGLFVFTENKSEKGYELYILQKEPVGSDKLEYKLVGKETLKMIYGKDEVLYKLNELEGGEVIIETTAEVRSSIKSFNLKKVNNMKYKIQILDFVNAQFGLVKTVEDLGIKPDFVIELIKSNCKQIFERYLENEKMSLSDENRSESESNFKKFVNNLACIEIKTEKKGISLFAFLETLPWGLLYSDKISIDGKVDNKDLSTSYPIKATIQRTESKSILDSALKKDDPTIFYLSFKKIGEDYTITEFDNEYEIIDESYNLKNVIKKISDANDAVKNQWSYVEKGYRRRNDLLSSLEDVFQSVVVSEPATFSEIAECRAKVEQNSLDSAPTCDSKDFEKFQRAQDDLSSALSRLFLIAERYPELKDTQSFRDFQVHLEGIENFNTTERMRFNEVANTFNSLIMNYPAVFIANLLGKCYQEKAFFKAEVAIPEVKFVAKETSPIENRAGTEVISQVQSEGNEKPLVGNREMYIAAVRNIRSIGNAIFCYMTDNSEDKPPIVKSFKELASDSKFVPFYIKKLPYIDPWGNEYLYKTQKVGDDWEFWIGCAGSDGKFSGFEQTGEPEFQLGMDIVYFSGKFVFCPQ